MASRIVPMFALKAFIAGYPSQRQAAKALGISAAYLGDILISRRGFSRTVLAKLGIRLTRRIERRQIDTYTRIVRCG